MDGFKYAEVGESFVRECEGLLVASQSLALLGPRLGGKSYVLDSLTTSLRQLVPGSPVVSCPSFAGSRIHSLSDAKYRVFLDGKPAGIRRGNPVDAALTLFDEHQTPVLFLAPNVDSLPTDLARAFLQKVRTGVDGRKLVVALSGELNFRDLVYGPGSEFACANQFVLRGFDRETFCARIEPLLNKHPNAELIANGLWEYTSGDYRVSRLLIRAAEELAQRANSVLEVSLQDPEQMLESLPVEILDAVLNRPLTVVMSDPSCAHDLESLLREGSLPPRALVGAPGTLEFSGLAVRRGDRIEIASPFMQGIADRHVAGRFVADLYAHGGNWHKAFSLFGELSPSDWVRPSGTDDRLATSALIQALNGAMATSTGTVEATKLFEQGARFILGFEEVTLWERRRGWVSVAGPVKASSRLSDLLDSQRKAGRIPLSEEFGRYSVAAILPARVEGVPAAVTISNFATRRPISQDRQSLAADLLEGFVRAYSQALQRELGQKRLETRDSHVQILHSILEYVGRHEHDVSHILAPVGNGLVALGYRRVMFSLVDSRREFIEGVVDYPENVPVKLSTLTRFELNDPKKDVQPYVIKSCKPYVCERADADDLVNPAAVLAGQLEAFAVIPILVGENLAIGTMHLERADKCKLTPQEIEDLGLFCMQLGRILAVTERLTLLQNSVDHSSEPLMITNADGEALYVNETTSTLFGLRTGWQDAPHRLFAIGTKEEAAVRNAALGKRTALHLDALGEDLGYRGEMVCEGLKDWRGRNIGAFVNVHDLRSPFTVLDGLTKIARAATTENTLAAIMDAFESVGFDQVRMYLVDQMGSLKSHLSLGLESDPAKKRLFEGGGVILGTREQNPNAWTSLDRRKSALFYYGDPDDESRMVKYSDYKLEARALRTATFPETFPRERGSYWLSSPLYVAGNPFGKVTVVCKSDLKPSIYESLDLLAQVASAILTARMEAGRTAVVRESATREAVVSSMATVAHNLGSRLAALPLLQMRYRQREKILPEIKGLNDDFETLVDHAMVTIRRVRDRLARIVVRRRPFDLVAMARRVLSSNLDGNMYELAAPDALPIAADPDHVESVLVELIQNSVQFAKTPKFLKVSIAIVHEPTKGLVRLTLRDNGPGIDLDNKEKVFQEFYSHRPGMPSSTGMGLTFVRRVIEAHGGTIVEVGAPCKGVKFVISLPAHQEGIKEVD